MTLNELTVYDIHQLMKKGEITSQEVVSTVLERIREVDKEINAYITVCEEKALEQARIIDKKIRCGTELGIFTGIPVTIKDNICVEGVETSCASHILSGFVPPYDATVIRKLRDAGAIVIGKTNMDEFAMGSSTENSYYACTCNPWNPERIPGGSSGGSAAAVACDEAIIALGSDTGGSIRQPAALCGVVGMKPTYGAVSRYGLVAFASSLDQIGPLTKDVRDAALILNVIAGHDLNDSTSVPFDIPDYTLALQSQVKGLKVGIPKEFFVAGMEAAVEKVVRGAIKELENMGVVCCDISLPHTEYAVATYYLIATAEASSNLARYDGVQYGYRAETNDLYEMYVMTREEGFGEEVKRRIILGTYALSAGYYDAYYLKAQKVRTLIKNDFDQAFQGVDCIITPTSPTTAFRIGEKKDDPLKMYLSDIFTISTNLAGMPAISLPCGYDQEGLPIGMQIIGKPFSEELLLRVAYTYEQHTDHHLRKPVLGKSQESR